MKAYGPIIRKIRLAKGFSQKEIYTGIVSKTYAIEFEKGIHEMNIHAFFEILSCLNMKINEFQFIAAGYHNSQEGRIGHPISLAANQKDYHQLFQYAIELQDSRKTYHRILGMLANVNGIRLQNNLLISKKAYPAEQVAYLKDYLLSAASWTLSELELYNNVCFIFDEPTQLLLLKYGTQTIEKYQENHEITEILLAFLSGFAKQYFDLRHFKEAQVCIRLMEKFPLDARYLFGKLLIRIAQIMEESILQQDFTTGMKRLEEVAEVFRLVDLDSYAEELMKNSESTLRLYLD